MFIELSPKYSNISAASLCTISQSGVVHGRGEKGQDWPRLHHKMGREVSRVSSSFSCESSKQVQLYWRPPEHTSRTSSLPVQTQSPKGFHSQLHICPNPSYLLGNHQVEKNFLRMVWRYSPGCGEPGKGLVSDVEASFWEGHWGPSTQYNSIPW